MKSMISSVVVLLMMVISSLALAENYDVPEFSLKSDTVNGQKFNYMITGNDENKSTILFIHGIGDSMTTFENQIGDKELSDKYNLVVVELPGHGLSSQTPLPNDFTIFELKDNLSKFIIKNGFDKGLIVGWSFGGNMTIEIANTLENVKGFMVYGTGILDFSIRSEEPFLNNPALDYAFISELTDDQMRAYVKSLYKPGAKIPLQTYYDMQGSSGVFRGAVGYYFYNGLFADQVNIVENLDRPIAILHGEKEQLINLEYIKLLNIPTLWDNKIHVVKKAGHAVHHENTKRFNKLLKRFAKEVL